MSTNPNGKGSGDNPYTVEGSIPSVLVLPSEAAQFLAQHLENTYYEWTDVSFDGLNRRIYIELLAKTIQDYWDSQM